LPALPQDDFRRWIGLWETKPRRRNPLDVVGLSEFVGVDWKTRFPGSTLEIRKVNPRVRPGHVEVQAGSIRLIHEHEGPAVINAQGGLRNQSSIQMLQMAQQFLLVHPQ